MSNRKLYSTCSTVFFGVVNYLNHDHGIGEEKAAFLCSNTRHSHLISTVRLGNEAKMSGAQHAEEILSL